MKKQLIAAAVAASFVMPMVAMAEATVYGRAHVSLDFDDDGTDSSMNISSNASRVGFKASTDLDNGMKAGAQMEGTVEVDNGGFTMNRNTFASLGGGFGEVRIGLHDTPFKDVRSKLDMFGDRVGDLRNLTRVGDITYTTATNTGSNTNQWDERFRNSILYISPKIAESWLIKAQYSTNTDANAATGPNANDNAAYSLSANGMAGPIGIWLAYENYDYVAPRNSASGLRVGLSWKVAAFKINFLYQTTTDGQITVDGTDGYYDRDVFGLGGAWKMGKSTFKLQYAMADDISCSGGVNCDNVKTAASTWGIGWDYDMGQKTTFYVMYAMTANDDNSWYRSTGGGGHGDSIPATKDSGGLYQDNSAFSVGYIVNF